MYLFLSSTMDEFNFAIVASFQPHSFTTLVYLKLDDDNDVIWQQVVAMVKGLKLHHFF